MNVPPAARRILAVSAAVALAVAGRAAAQGPPGSVGEQYVVAQAGSGRFALSVDGRPAPLYVAPGDFPGVVRAVDDLRSDIAAVTGAPPAVVADTVVRARTAVLIGTLGRSPLVDGLVRAGKLNAAGVAGRWETFVVQVVEHPLPGVDRALVIAGSDRRGTIYGIYDVSAQIGVSPWHWWADVPVRRQPSLFVLPGRHTQGEPAVRYRGIFINDEAPALSGWAQATFGGFDHRFYEKVFELVLRLKGNYLWPAMWGSAFYADDPVNARLADEYGVVIGTSHHEPMMRAHDEWRRSGGGPWNYATNQARLRDFWREGVRRMGANESVVTVGMRGDGDEPMTQGIAISLLERIVADQRDIIGRVTGRDPSTVPQVWALYKEVQDYYDQGMRVPDDVTLLFSDDNWGNVRRLPSAADRARPGAAGIYYHFDYVGGPRNYKWINTTQVSRVWEQMHLAWEHGADRLWIVNVGDMKPMELPISFFLDYAWNPARLPAEGIPAYVRAWSAQQLGSAQAEDVAEMLEAYTRFNSRRKPELLDTATYSLANYGEAERVTAEYDSLARRAGSVGTRLPPGYADAYDELVLFPVQASANLNALYHAVALNRLYARQGRAAANDMADSARRLFERDAELTRRYEGHIAGGKWAHMMDQTHIGYTNWQEPPRNQMPRVDVIQVPAVAEMGVAVEGSDRWWPASRDSAVLPPFDVNRRQTRTIEVFDRGSVPFDYSVDSGAPWLRVSPARGRVEKQTTVRVDVDWTAAPVGATRVPITIAGPMGRRVMVTAVVDRPASPGPSTVHGFVESEGVVAMEAEHFTRSIPAAGARWQRVPDLGRTLSAMTPLPTTAPSQAPGAGPRLEYRIHLFHAGDVAVHAYVSPSLDFHGGDGLRYAVSIDDEAPQVVNIHADGSARAGDGSRAWEQSVADNVKILVSHHHVAAPGEHVVKVWMVDPGVVLQRVVVDAGGLKPSYLGPPESFHRP
jgi:hypothetical protein